MQHDTSAQLQQLIQLVLEMGRKLRKVEDIAARASQNVQVGFPGGGGGGGAAAASYWVMPAAGGLPGSTGTFPSIIPSSVNMTVYQSIGGALNVVGVRTCYWWYRDALPQYTHCPASDNGDGTFDLLANSCTPVNP
jgi:hypothetical protein